VVEQDSSHDGGGGRKGQRGSGTCLLAKEKMSNQVGKEEAFAFDHPSQDWGLGFSSVRETIIEECEWV